MNILFNLTTWDKVTILIVVVLKPKKKKKKFLDKQQICVKSLCSDRVHPPRHLTKCPIWQYAYGACHNITRHSSTFSTISFSTISFSGNNTVQKRVCLSTIQYPPLAPKTTSSYVLLVPDYRVESERSRSLRVACSWARRSALFDEKRIDDGRSITDH